jgi:hypothetical protein
MHHDRAHILSVLDNASRAFTFPMLDNGYVYLAAARMSLFRSEFDWALVIEVFGYSPRSGFPDTHIHTFASRLHDRNVPEQYITLEAYRNYLSHNPNNESRFIHPIVGNGWVDSEDTEAIAVSGHVRLRDMVIPLPSLDEYRRAGITLESERPAVFELCRYLAAKWREEVLAALSERRVGILPELSEILLLDEWCHPDIVAGELPSRCETFQQLAEVLASGEPSRYQPSKEANTHWSNWPKGGRL